MQNISRTLYLHFQSTGTIEIVVNEKLLISLYRQPQLNFFPKRSKVTAAITAFLNIPP